MALDSTSSASLEHELQEAMLRGQLVDLRHEDEGIDDAGRGYLWGARRTVESALLGDLLTRTSWPRRPRMLRLAGARITGSLDLGAAELICPLRLRSCWFENPVVLEEAKVLTLALPGCSVPSLHAAGLTTQGNVELDEGFTARGLVNMHRAQIGGYLILRKASLTHPGVAFDGTGLFVKQTVQCEGFTTNGAVLLLGAEIGGNLQLDRSRLVSSEGPALYGDRLVVKSSILASSFSADGGLRLLGAQVGGTIELDNASLSSPDGTITLDLQAARADALVLYSRVDTIRFTNARIHTLVDEPTVWPRKTFLGGFIYEGLVEETPVSARQRLAWINTDAEYSPQPYEQLAAVYRRAGRDQDARVVAIAKQRARRRPLPPPSKAWSVLLDALVGYGYRTWLAGLWLIGFVLAGWLVFDLAHPIYLVAPKPPGERPLFHGGLYALDLLLPIGDLNYQGAWIARGWARGFWLGWILVGWVLTTAVVAALAGVLKRD